MAARKIDPFLTRPRQVSLEAAKGVYAITSLPVEQADAARLLVVWPGHWRIKNQVHWMRDVVFGEARGQVRSGWASQLPATLRNLVTGMLR